MVDKLAYTIDGSSIHIQTEMHFTTHDRVDMPHEITIDWTINPDTAPTKNTYIDPSDNLLSVFGEFYATSAQIRITARPHNLCH